MIKPLPIDFLALMVTASLVLTACSTAAIPILTQPAEPVATTAPTQPLVPTETSEPVQSPSPTEEPVSPTATAVLPDTASQPADIVDTAVADGRFTTLVSAVQAAG